MHTHLSSRLSAARRDLSVAARALVWNSALCLCGTAAFGAVDASLGSGSISSASLSPLTVNITGLGVGETVRVDRFLDADANGVIGAADPLVQSALVTDGEAFSIGGLRDTFVPGDEDGAANGQISVALPISGGAEMGRIAGTQLVRVSSPTTAFPALVRNLVVTNPAQTQSVSGTVTSGGSLLPGAGVIALRQVADDAEFAFGVLADATTGHYTLPLAAGSYILLPVSPGQIAAFEAGQVTVTTGADATVDLTMVAGTRTLSGKVSDAGTAAGLPGIQLFLDSENGFVSILTTDASGNYSAGVTPGNWKVEIADAPLIQAGYVPIGDKPEVNTSAGDATGVNVSFPHATTLLTGHVKDSSDTPLAEISLYAQVNGQEFHGDITTDANGDYLVALVAATVDVGIDSQHANGYIAPSGQSRTLSAGQIATANFTLQAVTAHVQGQVTSPGSAPVNDLRVGAYNQDTNQFVTATTAGDGTFDLGLIGGSWTLQIESTSASSANIVGTSSTVAVADGQTVTGASILVIAATAQITGQLTDSTPLPIGNANVYGYATIGGQIYRSTAMTDGSGHYQLPVSDGVWQVGASRNGENATEKTATISGANQTLNLILSHAPAIISPPNSQSVVPGQTLVFAIGTSSSGAVAYQWQVSTDAGANWANLTEAAPYSNVTDGVLNVTANSGLNGYQYRCVASSVAYPSEFTISGPATLTVLVTYATFKAQYFTTLEQSDDLVSGSGADPDRDGLSNLLEFAFNLNPKSADVGALPTVGQTGGHLTLAFVRRKDAGNLSYVVESSTDLISWNSGAGYTTELSVSTINGQTERITVQDVGAISSTARRFLRLKVTSN